MDLYECAWVLLRELDSNSVRRRIELLVSTLLPIQLYMWAGVIPTPHLRAPLFYEQWLSRYIAHDFFMHFRMTEETVEQLLCLVGPLHMQRYTGGNPPIPLKKAILMTLWYLAKGEVLVSVADRFNVAQSSTQKMTELVISSLVKLRQRLIFWPSSEEAAVIAEEFSLCGGYPGVVGAIDGCHIAIKPPQDQHDSYLNRKQYASLILQGVCTAKKFFINIFVGFPGSAHDARVFRESGLYREVEVHGRGQNFFYGQFHLIGDSAYPCKEWLMTPYRDTGRLAQAEIFHNKTLNSTRVAIENAFGLLKARWRILKYVNVYSVQKAVDVIVACCVLHNFSLQHEDFFTVDEVVENTDEEADESGGRQEHEDGIEKRNQIKDELWLAPPPSRRRRIH